MLCGGREDGQACKGKKKLVAAASDMLAAVKLDDDSETVMYNGMMMREVTLREESDRCTLVVNLIINTEDAEAVVDSGAQVSVLSKGFYDSLGDKFIYYSIDLLFYLV